MKLTDGALARLDGLETGRDWLLWLVLSITQRDDHRRIAAAVRRPLPGSGRHSSTMLSDARSSEPAPAELLDRKGTTELSMPISFEGGEARTIIVRVSVPITDAFGKIINETIKSQAAQFRTLADAAAVAAQAKLDVLGNPASVSELGGFGYIMTPSPRYQKTVVVLRLHSGRDKVFETELTYPNDINIVFRTSDTHQPQDR